MKSTYGSYRFGHHSIDNNVSIKTIVLISNVYNFSTNANDIKMREKSRVRNMAEMKVLTKLDGLHDENYTDLSPDLQGKIQVVRLKPFISSWI